MGVRRTFSLVSVSAASILFGLVTLEQSAAQDVSHICSKKYLAAKAAGTLNGETWPQFYSQCTAETKDAAAAAEATAAPPLDIRHICSEKYQAAKAAGTLNGEAWPQFYRKCTAETKANPPAITATPAAPVVTSPVVAAPAPPAVETPAPPGAPAPAPPPAVEAPAAPAVAPAPTNPLKTPASKQVAQTVVVRRPLPSFPPQFHRPMPTRSPTRRASKLVPINTKPTKQPMARRRRGERPSLQTGVLECNVAPGIGFLIGSSKNLSCVFHPVHGRPEYYAGTISRIGVDIGATGPGQFSWGVFTAGPPGRRYALAGDYSGPGAGLALGAGPRGDALVGGYGNMVSLDPLSGESTGVNLSVGIGALSLQPVTVGPRRHLRHHG